MSVGVDAGGVPPDAWGWLPLATGVAVVDTVAALAGIEAGLKWPNDVLVHGRKLAGILTEVAAAQRFIVVGIGLNVTLRDDEVPDADATSLRALGVATPDRSQVVRMLLRELGARFERWRAANGADAGLIDHVQFAPRQASASNLVAQRRRIKRWGYIVIRHRRRLSQPMCAARWSVTSRRFSRVCQGVNFAGDADSAGSDGGDPAMLLDLSTRRCRRRPYGRSWPRSAGR